MTVDFSGFNDPALELQIDTEKRINQALAVFAAMTGGVVRAHEYFGFHILYHTQSPVMYLHQSMKDARECGTLGLVQATQNRHPKAFLTVTTNLSKMSDADVFEWGRLFQMVCKELNLLCPTPQQLADGEAWLSNRIDTSNRLEYSHGDDGYHVSTVHKMLDLMVWIFNQRASARSHR